jgi:hypothetical protein
MFSTKRQGKTQQQESIMLFFSFLLILELFMGLNLGTSYQNLLQFKNAQLELSSYHVHESGFQVLVAPKQVWAIYDEWKHRLSESSNQSFDVYVSNEVPDLGYRIPIDHQASAFDPVLIWVNDDLKKIKDIQFLKFMIVRRGPPV